VICLEGEGKLVKFCKECVTLMHESCKTTEVKKCPTCNKVFETDGKLRKRSIRRSIRKKEV
jgi:DNA-directed RNA polymerase subunit M/transcription elongation factor TFIIS